MARGDQEGWIDEKQWNDQSMRRGPKKGMIYQDQRPTEIWDDGRQTGRVLQTGRVFKEGSPTIISESLSELYGILVIYSGPRRFDIHRIEQRKVTIGREQTDIVLDDAAIGQQHAVLVVTGNDKTDAEFRIFDKGADGLPSKAGTLVNGRYVTETLLRDRDRLRLGETDLLFVRLWPEVGSGNGGE